MKKHRIPFALYNGLLCLGAVIITMLVCLCAQEMEKRWYLKWDVSDDQISRLSDYTLDRLSALEETVTIYAVYPAGASDSLRDLQMETLGRMAAVCDSVRVEEIDPVTQPQRIAMLAGEAAGIPNGTLFIRNEAGTRVIRLDPDGFVFSRRIGEEVYTIYGGESQIIGAIERACTDDPVGVWFLTGHGELSEADCASLALQMRAMGFEVHEGTLSLMRPAAGDVLLLLGPTGDLTQDEADKLVAFLDGGGRLVLAYGADAPFERLTRVNTVMNLYGLGVLPGWVVENVGETAFYLDRPELLLPSLAQGNGVLEELPGRLILPRSAALQTPELRPGIEATALLTTSDRAVLKADVAGDATAASPDDLSGQMLLAVLAQQGNMRILQLSSSAMLRDGTELAGAPVLDASENIAFLAQCLDAMTDRDGGATIAAGVKQLPAQLITFDSEQTRQQVSAAILLLPGAIALVMAIVLIRRRRL